MGTPYRNHQWKITANGMDSCGDAPRYHVEANRLLALTDRTDQELYDWPVHMAEKNWVDIEAFIEAFQQALEFHKSKYAGEADKAMLADSFKYARAEARDAG